MKSSTFFLKLCIKESARLITAHRSNKKCVSKTLKISRIEEYISFYLFFKKMEQKCF